MRKTRCERSLKSKNRRKEKRDTTKRWTCCLYQDQLRETKVPSNWRLLSAGRDIFWISRIRLATRPRFLNTWRAATVSLGNFSLLRDSDVGWLEECSGGGHRVTAGRAQSPVSSGRNEQNIESWTPWCESESSRILFVEYYDTLFPSDYSACQVSIKGRALGCSATLCNRYVLFS